MQNRLRRLARFITKLDDPVKGKFTLPSAIQNLGEGESVGTLRNQRACKNNVEERIFIWAGENERLSTSGPIRCRGVGKAANSSRGGRRPVWATPRVLNELGG
jgi:hypothetical protein